MKLIDLCKSKPKYGAAIAAIPMNCSLPRYIRITDLDDDGLLKNDYRVSIKEEDAKPYILSEGEILFARTGSVGRTYVYKFMYYPIQNCLLKTIHNALLLLAQIIHNAWLADIAIAKNGHYFFVMK
jgi:hypothetical protein